MSLGWEASMIVMLASCFQFSNFSQINLFLLNLSEFTGTAILMHVAAEGIITRSITLKIRKAPGIKEPFVIKDYETKVNFP